jgi:hypothetical protein
VFPNDFRTERLGTVVGIVIAVRERYQLYHRNNNDNALSHLVKHTDFVSCPLTALVVHL